MAYRLTYPMPGLCKLLNQVTTLISTLSVSNNALIYLAKLFFVNKGRQLLPLTKGGNSELK